jgi:hypothetical protein
MDQDHHLCGRVAAEPSFVRRRLALPIGNMTFFDARFVDITYEMMLMRQHIQMLQSGLAQLVEAEPARIWKEAESVGDDDDGAASATAWHLEDALDRGVTTRYFSSASVIAVWAAYEAAVIEIADYGRKKRELELSIDDLKGGFHARAKKYYAEVLGFDLHPLGTDWTRLRHLNLLRNAIAHGNCRLASIDRRARKALEKWISGENGVRIDEAQYVIVSAEFADATWQFIDSLLHDLVKRAREEF